MQGPRLVPGSFRFPGVFLSNFGTLTSIPWYVRKVNVKPTSKRKVLGNYSDVASVPFVPSAASETL